jgi:hypothetical protein
MKSSAILRFLTPWLRRRREAERVAALRSRDGEQCARCRRALRFDLPTGHDQAPRIEAIAADGDLHALDNLRLTHRRCAPPGINHTDEVAERVRRKSEAALLARPRRRRKAA